jgi:hypothetical protein
VLKQIVYKEANIPFIIVVVCIGPALGYGDAEEPGIKHIDDHDSTVQ